MPCVSWVTDFPSFRLLLIVKLLKKSCVYSLLSSSLPFVSSTLSFRVSPTLPHQSTSVPVTSELSIANHNGQFSVLSYFTYYQGLTLLFILSLFPLCFQDLSQSLVFILLHWPFFLHPLVGSSPCPPSVNSNVFQALVLGPLLFSVRIPFLGDITSFMPLNAIICWLLSNLHLWFWPL